MIKSPIEGQVISHQFTLDAGAAIQRVLHRVGSRILARWMPELVPRPAQARRGSPEAQKICVAHPAEPGARFIELQGQDAYRAYGP